MSAQLHARGIGIVIGRSPILDGVDVDLVPGQRLAVVGPNGVGKSTLLRVLAGDLHPDTGSVTRQPSIASVGYLPQEPSRSPDESVVAFLARRTGVTAARERLERATAALADTAPALTGPAAASAHTASASAGVAEEYDHALDQWLRLGGADLENRAAEVLDELGLDARIFDQASATLSGGQAARVSLASVLLSRFDILLLDEPTNDLDLDGLDRLESFVAGATIALAVVSHDRAFLERTATHVLEIDEHERRGRVYAGGWTGYLDERRTARRLAEDAYSVYDEQRRVLRERARVQHQWSVQGVRAAKRDQTEPDKNIKAFRIATSERLAGKARATERALERLEPVDKPWEGWQLRFEIAAAPRSGAVVARLSHTVVERGAFRLGPVDLEIAWGDRVAITGANGSGKSTLIDLLIGTQPPDEGERWAGPSVVFGELHQTRDRFGEHDVLGAFCRASELQPAPARTLLAKFGLGADHVERAASSLSPGERTRLNLALFQARGVNCVVLDEPTNHLDLPAIEQLESALDAWRGTLLLVTHDRELLRNVEITRRLVVTDGLVREI